MRSEFLFRVIAKHRYQKFKESIKVLHNFTNSIIRQRREELKNVPPIIVDAAGLKESIEMGVRDKMALLDVLLLSTIDGKPLSDEAIREEVDTFMFEVIIQQKISNEFQMKWLHSV